MQHTVEFKGFEPQEGVRTLIEKLITRIDRKIKTLSPVFLRVTAEEVAIHKLYRVSITLDVPGKTLAAKEETHALEGAVRNAFAEIERQLDAYKADLRKEHWWKRLARRKDLREMKTGTPGAERHDAAAFFSQVEPHIERLTDFARHLIAYSESRGDLARGELATEDLVNDTLLRAHDEYLKDRPMDGIRSWLMRLALKQLEAEVKRSRKDRRQAVHIEANAPETPPTEEVVTLGDEILDFYQPDEDLKVEDVLPDIQLPTPVQELEIRELRLCVKHALNALPKERRRVLALHYALGFRGNELVNAMRKPPAEAQRILEDARGDLRRMLVASGCTFAPPHGAEKSPATAWNLFQKQMT